MNKALSFLISLLYRRVSFLGAALFLSACTYQYSASIVNDAITPLKLKSNVTVHRQVRWLIHPSTSIFLAKPSDLLRSAPRRRALLGLYSQLEEQVRLAFPHYHTQTDSTVLDDIFNAAITHNSELVFLPVLIEQQQRLGSIPELIEGKSLHPELGYGGDTLTFQVRIYEARTRRLIDIATVSSEAKMFSPVTGSPSELLAPATAAFVSAVSAHVRG